MATERALIALHSGAVLLSLTAALIWPRPGQPALMVPLGDQELAGALRWADREQAQLIELDTANGRIVARIPGNGSALRAIASGIMPIASRAPGCAPVVEGVRSW